MAKLLERAGTDVGHEWTKQLNEVVCQSNIIFIVHTFGSP